MLGPFGDEMQEQDPHAITSRAAGVRFADRAPASTSATSSPPLVVDQMPLTPPRRHTGIRANFSRMYCYFARDSHPVIGASRRRLPEITLD